MKCDAAARALRLQRIGKSTLRDVPDDVVESCKLVASVAALLLVADAVTGIDDLPEASLQKFAADPQFALQLVVTGLPVRRSREEVAKQALRLDRKAIVFEN